MPDEIAIQSYKEGDERSIFELFCLSYGGRQLPEDYWRWRFRESPAGPGLIELAWDRDVLAAHYAITSVGLQIEGEPWVSGLSGTTMTHPSYRGRGLFPVLARSTYGRMKDQGMAIAWGFPNTMSHRGFVRDLGWTDVYEIPMFSLPLTARTPKIPSHNHVSELLEFDGRFNLLWDEVKGDYDIIVPRDQNYLQWRYFSNPIERYRVVACIDSNAIRGYAVFKQYEKQLQVVDILVGRDSTEAGLELIGYIIQAAQDVNATSIGLWLNVTHPLRYSLERLGFAPTGPITYLGGLLLQKGLDSSIYDFRRWYFTMADSDVF